VGGMIHWLYERHIKRQLSTLPKRICFMITDQDMIDAPGKLQEITLWCRELGIGAVTFHVSTADPGDRVEYLPNIRQISRFSHLTLHYGDATEIEGDGMEVLVAIGKSGRDEITRCIRILAEEGANPESVDEAMIESKLTFRHEPDLVIKTGGDHLTDFLIWQSVYSELFFSDVNWKFFRKIDFLRAIRDYQFRQRRYGK
jgi:undecaprenyl diphosphate synthase